MVATDQTTSPPAIDPWVHLAHFFFISVRKNRKRSNEATWNSVNLQFDEILFLKGESDIIQSIDETVFAKRLNLETNLLAIWTRNGLVW